MVRSKGFDGLIGPVYLAETWGGVLLYIMHKGMPFSALSSVRYRRDDTDTGAGKFKAYLMVDVVR